MSETAKNDVTELSFEKALEQLEQIVDRLERGDVALEESIAIYEKGEALRARCDTLLKSAELKIEKIKAGRSGEAEAVEPLD